jgi:predicted small metal-binding protein
VVYEITCKACGQTFRHQDREQLVRDVEQHNRVMHGQPSMNRDEFDRRLRETA